ncbi:MAG: hypothetical protein ABIS27_04915, partial [Longimicrobiales bacterium]
AFAFTTIPHARQLNGQEQTQAGTKPAASLVASFDGLGVGFTGPQGTARLGNPSDNGLAVGPDHIVQVVNSRMAIFTKRGKKYNETGRVLYGPVNHNNVFKGFGGTCEARNNGDTVVRYDQIAKRWLIVMPIFSRIPYRADQPGPQKPQDGARASVIGVAGQPGMAALLFQPPYVPPDTTQAGANRGRGASAGGTGNAGRAGQPAEPQGVYSMCYAVSTSPDPLGSYYRYEFLRYYFPDYPRPAIWTDGYYSPSSTSDNRISPTVATEKHACVVERQKMLKGLPATEQCIILHNAGFLNNADIDGTKLPPKGAPNIMIAAGGRQLDNVFNDSVLNIYQFHVDWTDPSRTSVTGPVPIAVAPYRYLCDGQLKNCVTQPDTERGLDSQGDKIMSRLVYRRSGNTERIVAVHSIATSTSRGGVRWYEFRVDPASRRTSLFQLGTYLADSQYRWMASPAIDKVGNIGIAYSFGGVPHYVGQRFTGRRPLDPLGLMTMTESVLVEGEGSQTSTLRWEDYTTTAIDPSDDCTVWYVGDYLKKGAASYSTRIGAFKMPGCR